MQVTVGLLSLAKSHQSSSRGVSDECAERGRGRQGALDPSVLSGRRSDHVMMAP